MDKVREVALKALYKIDKECAYSNIALNEIIKENRKSLNEKDIGFISEIVYGTVTWKLSIDSIIRKFSSIRLKKISPWIINILRMGVYQIVFLDKIPKSAAVNESVNLAKRYGHKSSSNFVNAILRKIEKSDYEEFSRIENSCERLSKMYSMPEWIVEKLLDENEVKEVEEICKSSNLRPKISIRINKLKTNKKELTAKLTEKDIIVEEGLVEDFLIVSKMKNIENLREFKEGLFTIQDEAAGVIPMVLEPKENEYILDACSAPGGKTTFLAEMMNNNGKIDAFDIHEHRLKLINETAERLGINIIKTKQQDGMIYEEEYCQRYDKILLDVPCLGLGVLRRKPDIKWQKNKEDINEIVEIQYKILENCSKYLKNGGSLVYSTCSIIDEENVGVINKFLKNNPEFLIEEINMEKIKYFEKFKHYNKYIKVVQNNNTDGFFIVKIKKIES